jgi:hypothetical protein
MRSTAMDKGLILLAAGALMSLNACHRPAPPGETPVPEAPAPAAPASPAGQAPMGSVAPAPDPQAAIVAAATSVARKGEPGLSSMQLALPPSKRSVAVDLRYQFDGDVKAGQPVTLHLAAVPRVEGSNLQVSIKADAGIQATKSSAISVQKATASTAYRERISVTKLGTGPSELRVLVSMDTPEGSAFGWFGVPLNGAPAPDKQVKAPLE